MRALRNVWLRSTLQEGGPDFPLFEPVARVQSLVRADAAAFTLVLIPRATVSAHDGYPPDCMTFTIHGDYRPRGVGNVNMSTNAYDSRVTRRQHLKALEYLEDAAATHAEIDFVGEVYRLKRVQAHDACEITSRALKLDPYKGGTSVFPNISSLSGF